MHWMGLGFCTSFSGVKLRVLYCKQFVDDRCGEQVDVDCSLQHDVAGQRPATPWVHYTTSCNTQSSAPEDGQNNCPKHVELIGIINKLLLLHLVSCLYFLYQ